MSTSLVQSNTNVEITLEKLTSYLEAFGLANKLTKQEQTQFLEIALGFGLNPFKREIYAIKYGNNAAQIIVGYEVYLKRAELSGQFDGVETEFYTEDGDTICQVTIYRKDWSRPLKHSCFLSEYNQSSNPLWRSKPKTMLRKVTVSQAYRMAFPCELGGMPYTSDEMGVEDTTATVVQDRTPIQQKVDAISQPIEQALEAKPVEQPKPKALTKLENAELMGAIQNWHKDLGVMLADPDRNKNPIAFDVALTALKSIKNLPKKEMIQLFQGVKSQAETNGLEWNEKDKKFFVPEYDDENSSQPTDEELSEALADNG